MLDREKRLQVDEFLTRKAEVIDYIKHNKAEILRLKEVFMIENNDRDCKLIQISIQFVEGKNLILKTELSGLSAPKIAKLTGINVNQIRYQESLFNRSRIIL
jgi:hypothetical protein